MTQFGLIFSLPPVGAADVATRELSVTVNGAAPALTPLPGQPLLTPEMVFDQDDQLLIVLTDVDGAGNRSLPSNPFSYAVVDDVPPPQPGELGVSAKRQLP